MGGSFLYKNVSFLDKFKNHVYWLNKRVFINEQEKEKNDSQDRFRSPYASHCNII